MVKQHNRNFIPEDLTNRYFCRYRPLFRIPGLQVSQNGRIDNYRSQLRGSADQNGKSVGRIEKGR